MWFCRRHIQAYLSCRSQHVLLNHVTSDPLPVISGVPQGSILGPLMFNDIPSSIIHSNILLFADDTKCLRNVSSLSDCHSLQDDLVHLSSRCLRWNLQFNETKCVLLRICSNLPHTLFNYTINGTAIQVVDCILASLCHVISNGVTTSSISLLKLTKF